MSINVNDVSFAYQKAPVLQDINLDVPDGALCCLVGATGSGKSTLLKLVAGLMPPGSGTIKIDGTPTYKPYGLSHKPKRAKELFQHIGYVMQRPERQLFAETVIEDVAFGPENLGRPAGDAQRMAYHALKRLGVEDLADRSPFELSGGQQRLVAIAGVLAMYPANLVMDEPMGSLDPRGCNLVREAVSALNSQGTTILLVTHNMDDAARLASQIAVMHDGQLALQGSASEVFSHGADLRVWGLGLPRPLAYAEALRQETGIDVGAPLTLEALCKGLREALGGERACS